MKIHEFRIYDSSDIAETPQMVYSNEYDSLRIFFDMHGEKNLMAFTGVKDRNGRKIYEEDIIEITPNITEKYIGRVYFDDEEITGYRIEDFKNGLKYTTYLIGWQFNEYKIVGNTYENKELLK